MLAIKSPYIEWSAHKKLELIPVTDPEVLARGGELRYTKRWVLGRGP